MLFTEIVERLRTLAEDPGPLLVSVEGRLGHSPLSLVLEATRSERRVLYAPPALTDRDNRMALAVRLAPLAPWSVPPDDWRGLFGGLAEMAPLTLVVDNPGALADANRGFWREFGQAWNAVRRSGARIHLFLCSQGRGPGERLNAPDSAFRETAARVQGAAGPPPARVVRLDVGTHYDLGAAVPRWRGPDLLLGWSVLGGLPRTWAMTAGRGSPAAAVRRGLFQRGQPLADGPSAYCSSAPSGKINRYAAILRAVARGADSWQTLSSRVAAVPGAASVQPAPIMAKLRDIGLIAADRPLDAAPGGRRNRYRLSDPHETFWWSAIHPVRPTSAWRPPRRATRPRSPARERRSIWNDRVRPALPGAVRSALPMICRNYLLYGCEPVLGARARTVGPLWGSGFDFPVAATLANGAICYGHIHPGPGPAPPSALEQPGHADPRHPLRLRPPGAAAADLLNHRLPARPAADGGPGRPGMADRRARSWRPPEAWRLPRGLTATEGPGGYRWAWRPPTGVVRDPRPIKYSRTGGFPVQSPRNLPDREEFFGHPTGQGPPPGPALLSRRPSVARPPQSLTLLVTGSTARPTVFTSVPNQTTLVFGS